MITIRKKKGAKLEDTIVNRRRDDGIRLKKRGGNQGEKSITSKLVEDRVNLVSIHAASRCKDRRGSDRA